MASQRNAITLLPSRYVITYKASIYLNYSRRGDDNYYAHVTGFSAMLILREMTVCHAT